MAAPDISTSGRRYRKLLSILPARAAPSADMAGIGAGRRALSIGLALLITGVLLIMLLAFGVGKPVDVRDEQVTLVTGSEERRVGKELCSTGKSRWAPVY